MALDSLVRQAAVLVRAALDQAAIVDPAHVLAQLAEAEAARLRAEARAAAAAASAAEAKRQVEALTEALAEARADAVAARAELDGAEAGPGRPGRAEPEHGDPDRDEAPRAGGA